MSNHPSQGSASKAAGAMLNCFAEVTNLTFHSDLGRIKFEMALQARNLWPKWLEKINERLNDHKLTVTPGTFICLNSRGGDLDSENFDCIEKSLIQYEEIYEEVGFDSIPGLNPHRGSRPLKSFYLPSEGSIDSQLIITSLQDILLQNPNVEFIDNLAIALKSYRDAVTGVICSDSTTITADLVVVAAGAYSQKIFDSLPELAEKMPRILAGVGQSFVVTQALENPIQHVVRTPNRAGACGLHVVPLTNNQLYVGASNNLSLLPQDMPTLGIIHFIMNCLIEEIQQELYGSTLDSIRVGNRPVSIDGFPLLGRSSLPGLYILTGTYRDGFLQSPLLAQMACQEILRNISLFDVRLSPERKNIESLTFLEAIHEYGKHYIGSLYEHRINFPKFILEKSWIEGVRKNMKSELHKLNVHQGFTPDVLFMFDLNNLTSLQKIELASHLKRENSLKNAQQSRLA